MECLEESKEVKTSIILCIGECVNISIDYDLALLSKTIKNTLNDIMIQENILNIPIPNIPIMRADIDVIISMMVKLNSKDRDIIGIMNDFKGLLRNENTERIIGILNVIDFLDVCVENISLLTLLCNNFLIDIKRLDKFSDLTVFIQNTINDKLKMNKKGIVSCGIHHTAMIINNELFTFGGNTHGQLGLGIRYNLGLVQEQDKDLNPNITKPTKVFINDKKQNTITPSVTYVACGGYHTIFIADNRAYACGNNSFGQLGIRVKRRDIKNNDILILGVNGELYNNDMNDTVLEDNITEEDITEDEFAEILENTLDDEMDYLYLYDHCHTYNQDYRSKPVMIKELINCKIVACGTFHSIIYANNSFYSFGRNDRGQLGLGDAMDRHAPERISFFDRCNIRIDDNTKIDISCGELHTYIMIDGRIYVFGDNHYYQLGLGEYPFHMNTYGLHEPLQQHNYESCNSSYDACEICNKNSIINNGIYTNHNILPKYVACGGYHTLLLNNDNRVYCCGQNNRGQLGNHLTVFSRKIVRKINLLEKEEIITMGCGKYHSIVGVKCNLTRDNANDKYKIIVFGDNDYGQLGNDSEYMQSIPLEIEIMQNLQYIACGAYHTVIVADNRVYTFGCNNNGQLGHGHNNSINVPTKLENIILC